MSEPRPLGSLLTRLLARTGYDRQQGSDALQKAWAEVAPASLQGSSQPGIIRRGVLEVFVSHSALVQEFGFHKQAVLAELQQLVPAEGITDIRCRLLVDAGR
jgi:predicted nucleic acid-binding Zn ribbon protein